LAEDAAQVPKSRVSVWIYQRLKSEDRCLPNGNWRFLGLKLVEHYAATVVRGGKQNTFPVAERLRANDDLPVGSSVKG
jgi:hypothetical protein